MLRMSKGQYILDNISKKFDVKDLTLIGNQIIADIMDRTQSGQDVDNKSFKPYTAKYARFKSKNFGSTTVNLTQTNKMLNAMQHKPIPKGLRFYFNSNQQTKKAHGNQVKYGRKFFGLSSKDLQTIRKFITQQITK